MTKDELLKIAVNHIAAKSEDDTREYKAARAWEKHDYFGLMVSMVAFANSSDGGDLLIGVHNWADVEGMTIEQVASFDKAKMSQLLESWCSYPPRFDVVPLTIDRQQIVMIRIRESEEPILMAKELTKQLSQTNLSFRKSDIFIRTPGGESRRVRDHHEMQELLKRFAQPHSESPIDTSSSDSGSTGHAGGQPQRTVEAARGDEELATLWIAQQDIDTPRWRVTAMPAVSDARLISLRTEAFDYVKQSSVLLTGWDFPHCDRSQVQTFDSGSGGAQARQLPRQLGSSVYDEAWQMYRSGLFMWSSADQSTCGKARRNADLSDVRMLHDIAEYWLFVERLFRTLLVDSDDQRVTVKIELSGIRGRRLGSEYSPIAADNRAQDDTWTYSHPKGSVSVADLSANCARIAAATFADFADLFGRSPPLEAIEQAVEDHYGSTFGG